MLQDLMSYLPDIPEGVRTVVPVLSILLTLLAAISTQFFDMRHVAGDANKKGTITRYGWIVVFIFISTAVISFLAHREDEAEKKKKQKTSETNHETLTSNQSGLHADIAKLNTLIIQLHQEPDVGENKPEIQISAYEIKLSSLDISQCKNSEAQGYYGEIYVNERPFLEIQPADYVLYAKPQTGSLVRLDTMSEPITFINKAPEFRFSGHIREMTGRSFFRRYYQYRYDGRFSEMAVFKPGDEETFSVAFSVGDKCNFTLNGTAVLQTTGS